MKCPVRHVRRIFPEKFETAALKEIGSDHKLSTCPRCNNKLDEKLKTFIEVRGKDRRTQNYLCHWCCLIWELDFTNLEPSDNSPRSLHIITLSVAAYCFCRVVLLRKLLVHSNYGGSRLNSKCTT